MIRNILIAASILAIGFIGYVTFASAALPTDGGTVFNTQASVCQTVEDSQAALAKEGGVLQVELFEADDVTKFKEALALAYNQPAETFAFTRIDIYTNDALRTDAYFVVMFNLNEAGQECVLSYFWDPKGNTDALLELAFGQEVKN